MLKAKNFQESNEVQELKDEFLEGIDLINSAHFILEHFGESNPYDEKAFHLYSTLSQGLDSTLEHMAMLCVQFFDEIANALPDKVFKEYFEHGCQSEEQSVRKETI